MRIFGDHEPRTIEQLERCVSAAEGSEGVLCADGHVGYSQPIGGVVAYREHLSPSGVGYDIGCIAAGERVLTADGYHCAIEELGREHRPVRPSPKGIVAPIAPYVGVVAKGRRPVLRLCLADGRAVRLTGDHEVRTRRGWVRAEGLTGSDRVLCPAFIGLPYEPCELSADFLALAGVINGDGHIPSSLKYASVFTCVAEDAIAVAAAVERETGGYCPPMYQRVRPNGSVEVHVRINNRELVHRLVEFGCPAGRKRGRWDSGLVERLLALPGWARSRYLAAFAGAEATTPRYAEAMKLAGRYAYAGRDVVCAEVCSILGAEALDEVHNHHNYAWREQHGGEEAWVVRKGATPAFPGQRGFVGATMGEPAVILEGVESETAREALYSTVHGAGRVMSRMQAAGRRRSRWACRSCDWVQPPHTPKPDACPECGGAVAKRWVQVSEGAIDFPGVQAELAAKGIELRGGAADEAPGAYKRLDEVLAHHEGTVRVLHTLRPIGVAMAGADAFDPYKD